MSRNETKESGLQKYSKATEEIQKLVHKVIEVEKENINYKRPPRIKEILCDIVREVVR